jgi:hypothetical protein
MNIVNVRQGLADAVAAVSVDGVKLETYGYVPDNPSIPCFYAGEVTINNLTFGEEAGHDDVEIVCRVLTSRASDRNGQLLLDALLSRSGAGSIRAALWNARGEPGEYALDGACDDFGIRQIRGYRLYQVGSDTFYGAEIVIRAIGNGSE